MALERTLILIKPDGLARSLTGNILTELAKLDFEIIAVKMIKVDDALAGKHYEEHQGKPFFDGLVKYLKGQYHKKEKVMALVYEGENAIQVIRELIGNTNPNLANPISIRGKYGRIRNVDGEEIFENVLHASANVDDAKREVALWFRPDELVDMFPNCRN